LAKLDGTVVSAGYDSGLKRWPSTTGPMPRTRTSKRPARPSPRRTLSATGPSAGVVDAALEGTQLDETFTFREQNISVRWMCQHLVEEYARHNGHADLIREVIDGSAGL